MKATFTAILFLVAATVFAQIDSRAHWYDGAITYTATHIEHNDVRMFAMEEGTELGFVLRYIKEENPNHQIYTISDDNPDYINPYNIGTTARHQKSEGWEVLCFYDHDNSLKSVMSKETQWDAQKLNEARWLNQIMGFYISENENETEICLNFGWKTLNIGSTCYPYEIITFNGRILGFITVKPVEGELNELEGTWEIVPTLEGLRLCSVKTDMDNAPWEWQRNGKEYNFIESNPDVGRFFYASSTLLNDKWFRHFDQKTLRIMRNAILARHGYRFQAKDLQKYFAKEPWYKPAASNEDIKLSFVEQLNIELIKHEEKRFEK